MWWAVTSNLKKSGIRWTTYQGALKGAGGSLSVSPSVSYPDCTRCSFCWSIRSVAPSAVPACPSLRSRHHSCLLARAPQDEEQGLHEAHAPTSVLHIGPPVLPSAGASARGSPGSPPVSGRGESSHSL